MATRRLPNAAWEGEPSIALLGVEEGEAIGDGLVDVLPGIFAGGVVRDNLM